MDIIPTSALKILSSKKGTLRRELVRGGEIIGGNFGKSKIFSLTF